MKKRGPPPKPTKLKLITGNAGKRRLNEDEPDPEVLPNAEPPEYLSKVAKQKWPEMVDLLSRNGLFTALDVDALAIYCQAYADALEAQVAVEKHGATTRSPKSGYEIKSPHQTRKEAAWKVMREIQCEFGMGPASRTRVSASHAPRGNGKKAAKGGLLD